MSPAPVAATHVSTTAKAGAPHGAATTPDIAPITKTAPYEPPSVSLARWRSFLGTGTGITSSIAKAKRISRFPMAASAHGLALTVPKSWPVTPAMAPSVA